MDNQEEEIKPLGQLIPSQLTTNSDEPDPYILTEWEEKAAIEHAIMRKKEHFVWRFKEKGFTDVQIESKIGMIDFTKEIDRGQVLKIANSNKCQDVWMKERRKKESIDQENKFKELQSTWTANRMFKLMSWTCRNEFKKEFVFNDSNKHFITTICFFLSNDPRFETELKYSFNKGLLIRGTVGLGKTFVVRCVEKNELNPILILSMLDIAEEIKQNGEYQIRMGGNKIIYLDDVGTEEATVNHYGTKINYFKTFIEQCYLRNRTFGKLIISTNNGFAELEEKYGFRVRSRFKDMFNVVDVQGSDMRGTSNIV